MKEQEHNRAQMKFDPLSTEIESIIHTTNTQLEIWTDCLIGGNDANKAYNLSYSLKFEGEFVLEAFEQSLHILVLRHESLRALFSSDGSFMNIYKSLKIDISHSDVSQISLNEKEEAIKSTISTEVNTLFDLVKGPLFKIKLIKIDKTSNIVVLTHHHIIGDGLSINIIIEELSILYSSFIENKEANLTNSIRFSDYTKKINSITETEEYKQT